MKHILILAALSLLVRVQGAAATELQGLSVTQESAATGSIPLGAQRIVLLKLSIRQSCEADANIQSITIHHVGMGAVSDILKVYALENTSRLTRGATVQERNASAVLRFQPPLKVVACTSRTISVAVDVSPNAAAGSEHAFKVKSGKDFQSDTRVSFLSETKQGVITTKPKSVGLVTFTPLPTASRNVLFGTDRTLLRFSLKATSQTKMQVDAISFTNNGSARNTDIVQLSVKRRDGRLLSDVAATLTDDGVRLIFSTPFVLEKNETHVLTLSGNVTASRRRTIDFTVSEPGDIETREAPRS